MFQSKQQLVLKTIQRNGLAGITNLALRFYEQEKKPLQPHYVPTALQVEVTTACNLKCTMCEHTYMQNVGGNLGIGEALLNRSFLEMVEYAKQKGIYAWFSDNMTLLTEEIANRVLDAGVDLIVLSLDGATPETFEKIRVGAKREENIMGNVLHEDLTTIWNGEKYHAFREKMKTNQPPQSCKKCPKFYGLC
ncbi:MAG: SPASM domain-containing protein [Candidatus Diapherotrites archaeon]|nr:SPASM domain-containing protein [Candidatus Diapherotrites archaeon]